MPSLSPLPIGLPRSPLMAPFREILRRYKKITFVHVDADRLGDKLGEVIAIDGHAWIFLDDSCTIGEFTATIGHELAHLDDPEEADEAVIEGRTAELFIPLADAMAATTVEEIEAVARRHGVDSQMVRARTRTPPPATMAASRQAS